MVREQIPGPTVLFMIAFPVRIFFQTKSNATSEGDETRQGFRPADKMVTMVKKFLNKTLISIAIGEISHSRQHDQ
jgi:hypothetical protein